MMEGAISKLRRATVLACLTGAIGVAFAPYIWPIEAASRESGIAVLDEDGSATVRFERGFIDNHFCVVADGWDEVSVGFSAKGFTLFEGRPGQRVDWACSPLPEEN